jgi:hypothetical protein
MYGTDISRETMSRITDAVVEDMTSWHNRPLDRISPVGLIDAINLKTRDGEVAKPPGLCGHGRQPGGRARGARPLGRAERRGVSQVLNGRADRASQPGHPRLLHRVL